MSAMGVKNLRVTITLNEFLSFPTKEAVLQALKEDLQYGVENYMMDDEVVVKWEEIDEVEPSVREALMGIKNSTHLANMKAVFSRLMQAKTLAEFTTRKRKYMLALVQALPTSTGECAYCIKYKCKDCPYGYEHKICHLNDSDYNKLIDARDKLFAQISNY